MPLEAYPLVYNLRGVNVKMYKGILGVDIFYQQKLNFLLTRRVLFFKFSKKLAY